ncbi:hypothetical protein WN943_022366 [Citrus x changshan-huyou]
MCPDSAGHVPGPHRKISGTVRVRVATFDIRANPTSAKHGRDAGFIRGDPHLNWQDAFWGVWAPQEQIRAGLVKAQSGQYLVRSGLGHDIVANPTSAKHGRDAGFIRGDPHLNWQDAFWGVWAPQEQICAGLVKAQSGQYLVRSGLGHDIVANPTSAKHGRDAGFIRGDPHLNWQDAFWGVWAPQEQIRAGLVKAQSGQYLVRSGLGHDTTQVRKL